MGCFSSTKAMSCPAVMLFNGSDLGVLQYITSVILDHRWNRRTQNAFIIVPWNSRNLGLKYEDLEGINSQNLDEGVTRTQTS